MSELQYGHDDARDYEPYFSRHLMAMTAEDLHSKGEIACELAYRDTRIAELENLLVECRGFDCCPLASKLNTADDRIAELKAENQRLRDAHKSNSHQELKTVEYAERGHRCSYRAAYEAVKQRSQAALLGGGENG